MKAEEKQELLRRRHPDIEFQTAKGAKIKLTFEKNEYRAYKYDDSFAKWVVMGLGGLDAIVLRRYIEGRY